MCNMQEIHIIGTIYSHSLYTNALHNETMVLPLDSGLISKFATTVFHCIANNRHQVVPCLFAFCHLVHCVYL